MTVNGGLPDPGVSNIATNNPNGGHPAPVPPAKSGPTQTDKVVTTNASGAFASHHRPRA
jgi:hypothetical protein